MKVALLGFLHKYAFFYAVFISDVPRFSNASFSIPGTTQTENGYDTELGNDPICWRSEGDTMSSSNLTKAFPNYLLSEFKLDGQVELLRACPQNNSLRAFAPVERLNGVRLRTHQWYNYTVDVTLDLASLGGNELLSDNVTHRVSVQVVICELGKAGFCSPFIHEEANARLAAENVTQSPPVGEAHGGTHLHSPRVSLQLEPKNGSIYEFSTVVPMLSNVPGDYFAIAAVQLFVHNASNSSGGENRLFSNLTSILRYDMSNKMEGNYSLLTYQSPPTVLEVPLAVRVLSYIGIALVGSAILFLIAQSVRHRNNKVLQLTQGPFLIVFLVAALVATIGSFLLEPVNDVYCQAGFPIVLISLQLLFAVTIGRLWRINAVISPLLMQTLRQEQNCVTRLGRLLCKWNEAIKRCVADSVLRTGATDQNNGGEGGGGRRNTKALRRQVTSAHLAAVIGSFTVPQVIIQVLSLTLQPSSQTIYFNDDESIGRAICSRPNAAHALVYYGCYVFFLLVVLLLFLAYSTRGLPSLLNETRVIFDSTLSSLVLLFLGLGVISVTRGPTTSPGVEYLVSTLIILSLTLNMSWRIMMPKLRMVWRGETVLVSKLVFDHARSVRKDDEQFRVSGLSTNPMGPSSKPSRPSQAESGRSDSDVLLADMERFDSAYRHARNSPTQGLTESSASEFDTTNGASQSQSGHRLQQKKSREDLLLAVNSLPSGRRLSNRIVVNSSETPARRLVLRLVDLQEHLSSVNDRIMSGLVVSEEEWTKLRNLCCKMGVGFRDEIKFEWEESEELLRTEGKESTGTDADHGHRSSRSLEGFFDSTVIDCVREEDDDDEDDYDVGNDGFRDGETAHLSAVARDGANENLLQRVLPNSRMSLGFVSRYDAETGEVEIDL